MADRLELHSLFQGLLGSSNVYYQPPESVKMKYDAIRYSKKNIDTKHADDTKYIMRDCYELTVISRMPDNPVIKKLLALPYCSYDRNYVSDNLNHDVLTIYY